MLPETLGEVLFNTINKWPCFYNNVNSSTGTSMQQLRLHWAYYSYTLYTVVVTVQVFYKQISINITAVKEYFLCSNITGCSDPITLISSTCQLITSQSNTNFLSNLVCAVLSKLQCIAMTTFTDLLSLVSVVTNQSHIWI